MHTFVSGGQANTHTASLLHELKTHCVSVALAREHSMEWKLPRKYGSVSPDWLNELRLNTKDHSSFSSYASTMLILVPIIFAFLMDNVYSCAAGASLTNQIRCYGLLASIISLLQRVDTAYDNVQRLISMIDEWHAVHCSARSRKG